MKALKNIICTRWVVADGQSLWTKCRFYNPMTFHETLHSVEMLITCCLIGLLWSTRAVPVNDCTLKQNARGHFLAQRCKRSNAHLLRSFKHMQIPLLHFPSPVLSCRYFHSRIFSAPSEMTYCVSSGTKLYTVTHFDKSTLKK